MRVPKHGDIVLTTARIYPGAPITTIRVLIWDLAPVAFPPGVVHSMKSDFFHVRDYGLTWVYEDDLESADAFRVAMALS